MYVCLCVYIYICMFMYVCSMYVCLISSYCHIVTLNCNTNTCNTDYACSCLMHVYIYYGTKENNYTDLYIYQPSRLEKLCTGCLSRNINGVVSTDR